MQDILNNAWVTGIGGGLISSVIVFFATRYFFSKRDNGEYIQKTATANNEILYSIRPLIIEKRVPTQLMLNAVRFSSAKKYGVRQVDLYNEFTLSSDLMNEIMGNSFLSSDQKIDFCNLLQTMRKDTTEENKEVAVIYLKDKHILTSNYNSILLAIISFITAFVFAFLMPANTIQSDRLFNSKFPFFLLLAAIPIFAAIFLYTIFVFLQKERRKEKRCEENIIETEKSNS